MFQQNSSLNHSSQNKTSNTKGIPFNGRSEGSIGSSSKIYQLSDVSVRFGKILALDQIRFNVERGEIVFITGASGAGKTTLLRVLSEEISPSQGQVYSKARSENDNLFVSKVFQDLRLYPKWTCEQNLLTSFDRTTYTSKDDFLEDMHEIARVLGFADRLDLEIYKANGGLKQKVAIARALLTKPDIFIADEPTSSLDAENAQRIFDVLNLYNHRKGMTVIWASHNKELVKRFSGRIVHIENGKLIYSGHACFI